MAQTQPYPAIISRVDTKDDTFKTNTDATTAAMEKVENLYSTANAGGGEKYNPHEL